MELSVSRAAMILYSSVSSERGICALFGVGANGLTTLGGRKSAHETWVDCLIRELIEETRGILDYSLYNEIFLTAKNFYFDQCIYVLIETSYETLRDISLEFPRTSSSREVCNELSSLEVCLIDDLIKDMIIDKKRRYNENFLSMFLTVGYDTLKGNTWNYMSSKIDLNVVLEVPISQIPKVVCLTPINRGTPVIYGTIPPKRLFITDQMYLREGNKFLYRSGWKEIQSSN
jgi:hypothetical protein